MTNAPPSAALPNQGSLVGMMREVLNKFLNTVDDMLPAEVIAFNRESNVATVKPLIMMVDTAGNRIARAQIASVPVFQIGAGGFVMNFNLNPGDLGYIKANDRDISLFVQSATESQPNTYRAHSFEDGVFFPAVLRGVTIAEEDAENLVIQSLDSTQRVSIWPDRVKITSDNKITLDAPLVEITGIVTSQSMTVDGTIIATVDVIAGEDDISLVNHIHGGVQPGAGTTTEPVGNV